MEIKKMNGRIQIKGATEAEWNKAIGFIPLDKEPIEYKPDEFNSAPRFKIGDGVTPVQDLPFIGAKIENGIGIGSVQQLQDQEKNVTEGYFNFTDKNPNATEYDSTLTWEVKYGAQGDYSVALGGKAAAIGKRSLAEGTTTIAKGAYSHVEGNNSVTLGANSHAEGKQTTTIGENSHSEGFDTIAEGYISHAEGYKTHAKGVASHTQGQETQALGDQSSAGGYKSTAEGHYSVAQGYNTHTIGKCSFTTGEGTIAEADYQTVIGRYNVPMQYVMLPGDKTAEVMFIVGNGYTDEDRDTAFAVLSNGEVVTNYTDAPSSENSLINLAQFYELITKETVTSLQNGQVAYSVQGGIDSIADYKCDFVFGEGLRNTYEHQAVFGRYNDASNWGDNRPLFMVGNGENGENRSNAFEVLKDGRARVTKAPEEDDDVIRLKEHKQKFDKAGGIISGDVAIQGNLSVSGTTTTKDTETLQVKDNVIVANADGVEIIEDSGFAIKTSTTDAYGIMYDPVGDGVKIGLGYFDENGKFIYEDGQAQFLATRADSIENGHIPKWDDEAKQFVDSGAGYDEFVKFTDYAKNDRAGVVKNYYNQWSSGIEFMQDGSIRIAFADNGRIDAKHSESMPIVPKNLDYATMKALSDCKDSTLWTDDSTVDGELVKGTKTKACETIGAVKKRTMTSGNGRAYGYSKDGETDFEVAGGEAKAWSIAQRTYNGRLLVGTPEADNDAINKKYAEDNFVAQTTGTYKVYGRKFSDKDEAWDATYGNKENTVMIRNGQGRSRVNNPVDPLDIANKDYVDTNFVAKITEADASYLYGVNQAGDYNYRLDSNASNFSVAQRGADGVLAVATPTAGTHATTKDYVDNGFVVKMVGTPDSGATRGFIYGLGPDGTTSTLYPIQIQANVGTVAYRNSNGNFYVGTPTLPYECANKGYVDKLPDNLSLSDEQKTAWRGMIGATKLFLHTYIDSIGSVLKIVSTSSEEITNFRNILADHKNISIKINNYPVLESTGLADSVMLFHYKFEHGVAEFTNTHFYFEEITTKSITEL